jgi:hypothetical protein
MEKLETRELMAGDVAASVMNGDLYLTEATGQAGLDNAVWISKLFNGNIRVDGNFAPDGTRSHVNGQNFQEFAVTGKLFVNFGGGRDLVAFDGMSKPVFQEVNIDVGASTAVGNSDDDDVMIWGAVSRGNMNINTGAGEDWVYVTGADIGTMTNRASLTINSGAGADEVDVESLSNVLYGDLDIQTYATVTETDADLVNLEDVTMTGDLRIRLGGGDDNLLATIVSAYDDIDINTGAGKDTAKLDYVNALDDLMARMGDGDDRLEIYHSTAADFIADGEGGSDSIWTRSASGLPRFTNSFGTSTLSNWEWVNGVRPWLFEPIQVKPIVGFPVIRF